MKTWLAFVIGAGLCWGTYVPLIAYGGKSLSSGLPGMGNRFAAILCVGGAYVLLAVLFPLGWFLINGTNNAQASPGGITFSGLAGAAGALGAICVVFATAAAAPKDRLYIAPLIFTLAPVINTLVSLIWHPTAKSALHFSLPEELPSWKFFVGIILAAAGAGLVLYSKEESETQHAPPGKDRAARGPTRAMRSNSMPAPRLAILISAGGTTLQYLIDAIDQGTLDARIVQVVSSNAGVLGIERAIRAGLPVAVTTRKDAGSRAEFSERVFGLCRQAQADLVCMAGFLQIVTIPPDFEGRVMNIHPSLIPAFCGKGFYGYHVHEAVLAMGVKLTGCTVHFADNEYDHGPIILQKAVPVLDDDNADTLAARVFESEKLAYPEAIQLFSEGRLRIEGRRVLVKPTPPPPVTTGAEQW